MLQKKKPDAQSWIFNIFLKYTLNFFSFHGNKSLIFCVVQTNSQSSHQRLSFPFTILFLAGTEAFLLCSALTNQTFKTETQKHDTRITGDVR